MDVYRVSLEFVAWAYESCKDFSGVDRHARDQLLRASQSIPLNIAEGNGKRSYKNKWHFFEIARGSALECAAILDILVKCQVMGVDNANTGKDLLYRIVSMLTRMIGNVKKNELREEVAEYENEYAYEYDKKTGILGAEN